MIGKLKGTLLEVEGNIGLVDTSTGLAYHVFLTPSLLSQHYENKNIDIYTYLQVKEDDLILFGFENKTQRELFKMLIAISGVGPKTAYGIVSFSKEDEIMSAAADNDVEFFSKVPGLGRKTAMKIILEISQKLKSQFSMEKMYLSDDDKTVVDALVSLGFKAPEAKKVLQKVDKKLSIEEKIREALKLASVK